MFALNCFRFFFLNNKITFAMKTLSHSLPDEVSDPCQSPSNRRKELKEYCGSSNNIAPPPDSHNSTRICATEGQLRQQPLCGIRIPIVPPSSKRLGTPGVCDQLTVTITEKKYSMGYFLKKNASLCNEFTPE